MWYLRSDELVSKEPINVFRKFAFNYTLCSETDLLLGRDHVAYCISVGCRIYAYLLQNENGVALVKMKAIPCFQFHISASLFFPLRKIRCNRNLG